MQAKCLNDTANISPKTFLSDILPQTRETTIGTAKPSDVVTATSIKIAGCEF